MLSPDSFRDSGWSEVEPFFRTLQDTPLSAESLDAWLRDWSEFESALSEARELAAIAASLDTGDPVKAAAERRFSGEIWPRAEVERTRLAGRLLKLGSDAPELQTVLRRFRANRDRFRVANVPLFEQLQSLDSRYQQITGAMIAEWEGTTLPLTRLTPFVLDHDRTIRERAYVKSFTPFGDAREELADLFDAQVRLRQQIAVNAGSANYRDYAFRERNRFDYTPDDCLRFHEAVEQEVIPAIERRYLRRRQQLGINQLRAWDVENDLLGRPPLAPYSTTSELIDRAEVIFTRIDPTFGDAFRLMREEGMLDLESRQGKRAGGFCASLEHRQRPFIFMNAAGIHRDIETLIHEGGHAVHAFATFESLPLIFQREPDIEMGEMAAMTLELLALPFLAAERGGFYSRADAARAEIEQLERVLTSLAWIATIDAFQHWVYTAPEGVDRDARDAAWCQVYARFAPWLDWSGHEPLQRARWYRQLHIFLAPFYYIEYGIARLGALQIWRNSRQDQVAALTAFRRALVLGCTRPLPELFAIAGAKLTFDFEDVHELVELVETRLQELGSD